MPDETRAMDGIIERSLRGGASDDELRRLAAWRAASPDNELAYRRTAQLITSARELAPAAAVPPRPDAAAILGRSRGEAVASAGRAQVAAGAVTHDRPGRRRLARWAPWLVAAAAVLVALIDPWGAAVPAPGTPAEVATGASELATVKLADGSVVRLAPSSRLQLAVGAQREVMLEGRAFFAVASVPGEPFRVRTRNATAQVLGTRFELATDDAGVRLLVLEGRVSLDAPQNSVEVSAGEQSGVRDGAASPPTPLADRAAATAWMGRFLVFQATPLRDAAAEIERLYGSRIIVADSALAAATVTATFTDRAVEDVVRVVCSVLGARCVPGEGVVTIGR